MLIVLEGLDGAGKSTQINLLQTYFEKRSTPVRFIHFPRFDSPVFGELIAKFLRGDLGKIEEVHPMLVALLFAGDRKEASSQINDWLKMGCTVILDRYVYSNIAFQCAKCSDESEASGLRDWILDTEYNEFGIPRPDMNLFLDVPIRFVDTKLKEQRGGEEREYLKGKQDIHEESISFQSRVRDIYLSECNRGDDLVRVECFDTLGDMLPAQKIHQKITDLI